MYAKKLANAALLVALFFTVQYCFVLPRNKASGFANYQSGGQGMPMVQAATQKVYYEPTIKKIIIADCGRCHSGVSRNLMDYDNLNAYAYSGMLGAMVQSSMRRFAGSDAQTILAWINSGAPEKPAGTQAHFMSGNHHPPAPSTLGCIPGGHPPNIPAEQITYNNSIKNIFVKDCFRCHSGQFRNLTTYKNVKMYVDNGLLKALVQLGGPMHRFAGPDSRQIIAWVNSGAPR